MMKQPEELGGHISISKNPFSELSKVQQNILQQLFLSRSQGITKETLLTNVSDSAEKDLNHLLDQGWIIKNNSNLYEIHPATTQKEKETIHGNRLLSLMRSWLNH